MRGSGGTGMEETHLSSCVYLPLSRILALSKDSRSLNLIAILPTNQIRRLQEDSGTVVPGHVLPFFLRSQCILNSLSCERGIGFVVLAEVACMRGREGLVV